MTVPTQEEWEDAIVKSASYFTVVSGHTPSTRVKQYCLSWWEAKTAAGNDITKMVYAVTQEGHATMLPRSRWDHYDQLIGGK
jgi:hypothetical protein